MIVKIIEKISSFSIIFTIFVVLEKSSLKMPKQ